MNEELVQIMIKQINEEIKQAITEYERFGNDETIIKHSRIKVSGMMTMLELVSGRPYYFDNNGVHER